MDKQAIGQRIRDIRLNNKVKKEATMEEFAEIIGSNKSNVSRWERGKNIPNEVTLRKIAKLGDVTVNDLLYGTHRLDTESNELKDHITNILKVINTYDDYVDQVKNDINFEEENAISRRTLEIFVEHTDLYMDTIKKIVQLMESSINVKKTISRIIDATPGGKTLDVEEVLDYSLDFKKIERQKDNESAND